MLKKLETLRCYLRQAAALFGSIMLCTLMGCVALVGDSDPDDRSTYSSGGDPPPLGWVAVNGVTSAGNNFGWSSSGPSIGGTFARSATPRYFVNSGWSRWLKRSETLSFSGELVLSNHDFDGSFFLGFVDPNDLGRPISLIGFAFNEPGGAASGPFRARATVRSASGQNTSSAVVYLSQNTSYSFSASWKGNPDGSGTLSGQLGGQTFVISQGPANESFGGFGVGVGIDSSSGSTLNTGACSFSKLTFSLPDGKTGGMGVGGGTCVVSSASVKVLSHDVVQKKSGVWMMGAANKSANQWVWGKEIVVSYDRERFVFSCPYDHNVPDNHETAYDKPDWSRSLDGGKTWTHYNGPTQSAGAALPIDFKHPGFGLRIWNSTQFIVTYDRWKTYQGPYTGLSSLMGKLKKKELTSRTDYIVNGANEILLFLSARDIGQDLDDFTFVARSQDGGKTFQYLSRINPWGDAYRGVMPSAVRVSGSGLVACLRRRPKTGADVNWIDCYRSDNNGTSWRFVSRVDETGYCNGNPPAMARLPNGLLAMVYGVRKWWPSSARMALKVSADEGSSWQLVGEKRLRDNYHVDVCGNYFDASDLGYPRLFVLPGGQLRAVYAWSDGANENHIDSTLFEVKASCQ